MSRPRSTTIAGVVIAIGVILAIMGKTLPVMRFLFIILCPLPLVVATMQIGIKRAFFCMVAMEIIMFFVVGPTYTVFVLAPSLVGMVIGWMLRQGHSWLLAILCSFVASACAFWINYLVALYLFNIDTLARFSKYGAQAVQMGSQYGLGYLIPNSLVAFVIVNLVLAFIFAIFNYFFATTIMRKILVRYFLDTRKY